MRISTEKLVRVLRTVDRDGFVYCTDGGEVAIAFIGQIDKHSHNYLLSRGFVLVNNKDYVYRPKR